MSTLEIMTEDELQEWLESMPTEWVQVLALRTSLRVLPFVFDKRHYVDNRPDSLLALIAIRATAIACSIIQQRELLSNVDIREELTTQIAYTESATATVARAAFAAHGALRSVLIGDHQTKEAFTAIKNALAAVPAARDVISRELLADRRMLESGVNTTNIMNTAIWRDHPKFFQDSWILASRWLLETPDDFVVWHEWFTGRMFGQRHSFFRFDDAADATFGSALISRSDEWWSRESKQVNLDVANLVESLRDDLSIDDVRELLETTASPEAVQRDEKIDLRANRKFETPEGKGDQWLPQHLLDLANFLHRGLSRNAPPALRSSLSTYADVLQRNPQQPVLQTLENCISPVRQLYCAEGHEAWAAGLNESFQLFLSDHQKLAGDFPATDNQKIDREKLALNADLLTSNPLSNDVEMLASIVGQLEELGVTTDAARQYLEGLVALGMELAYGYRDSDHPDPAMAGVPDNWSPSLAWRANMAGLTMQIESKLALMVSVTGHPQFAPTMTLIREFVAYVVRYFMP